MPKLNRDTYSGQLAKLRKLLLHVGLSGEWIDEPNGVHRFKGESGASFHWSETTGSVWFDGPEEAKRELREEVQAAIALVTREQAKDQGESPRSSTDRVRLGQYFDSWPDDDGRPPWE
jgi:hypothetical protein